MRAAVLSHARAVGERPLEIGSLPTPLLQPGHVLLKVRACGVCRTDLHIVEGELPTLKTSLIPGHQIVGDVVDGAIADLPIWILSLENKPSSFNSQSKS